MNNLDDAIKFCIKKVDKCIETMNGLYPGEASVNEVYEPITYDLGTWTQGFWTGMVWLAYEFTGDEKYKKLALKHVDEYSDRIKNKIGVNHHDMGFLYCPSCVAAYKLCGSEKAKEAAILAADNLCTRFNEKAGFIQAWGEVGAEDNFRLIIDCLLNIPLLFWASDVTGNENYRRIAETHLNTAVKYVIRPDGTTYHTYFFDTKTGEPLHGATHQGYSDDSIWARGQAWGVYGLALGYLHTKNPELVEKYKLVTRTFIEHLPEDNIPAWDMIFTDTKTQKDTSAAAIAVCGILEMDSLVKTDDSFIEAAHKMMDALPSCYTGEHSNGILAHAVYGMPQKSGIDECNIWGDYYYMEALMRIKNPNWNSYWK